MSKKWYYNQDDAPCGPVDEPEIIRLIQSGELTPGVLVCFEGGSEWLPAHQYTCFKVEVHPKEKTPEPATSLPAPKPVSTGTLQSPGQISISPEARQALEQGDIAAAVQTTAAENPNLRRLEICALLGEAVLDNRPAAIPIAEPLRWDQDLMRLNGIQGVHVDISLAGWKENYKQEHKNVAKALDKPFPDSDARRRLRNVSANQMHQGNGGVSAGNKSAWYPAGGCCLLFVIGSVLLFFFPGWGSITMGLGILMLVYRFSRATSKEEADLDLIKSAKPIYPSQAQTGAWNIVSGRIKCAAPITSVVADVPLAYVHVMLQKNVEKLIYVPGGESETFDLWTGLSTFHVRRELLQAWLEADGGNIGLLGSDYESLIFLEGELPSKIDFKEVSLKNTREGRSESGIRTGRTESHTARAFLLDDGLHMASYFGSTDSPSVVSNDLPPVLGDQQGVSNDIPPVMSSPPSSDSSLQSTLSQSMDDRITVTARCFAMDDEVWAAGYLWEDERGGKTMGSHLYQDGWSDSNILFLTDHDWQKQIAESEREVHSSAIKMYIAFAVATGFMLLGALIVAFDKGAEISGWLRSIMEE